MGVQVIKKQTEVQHVILSQCRAISSHVLSPRVCFGHPSSLSLCVCVFVFVDFRWYCSVRGGVLSADVFVVACCDGSFRIMSSSGRLEKSVPNAHTGAVTAVAWNFEGTALATAGEDGCVKQWSRSGNLRSKLATYNTNTKQHQTAHTITQHT